MDDLHELKVKINHKIGDEVFAVLTRGKGDLRVPTRGTIVGYRVEVKESVNEDKKSDTDPDNVRHPLDVRYLIKFAGAGDKPNLLECGANSVTKVAPQAIDMVRHNNFALLFKKADDADEPAAQKPGPDDKVIQLVPPTQDAIDELEKVENFKPEIPTEIVTEGTIHLASGAELKGGDDDGS